MNDDLWFSYTAGFFDGEGSVAPNLAGPTGRSGMISVKISQKYPDPLESFLERWGGGMGIDGPCYYWMVQRKADVLQFLTDIQPYSIVKARQIELAIEFLTIVADSPRKGYYSDNQVAYRKSLLEEISKVNHEKLGVR